MKEDLKIQIIVFKPEHEKFISNKVPNLTKNRELLIQCFRLFDSCH